MQIRKNILGDWEQQVKILLFNDVQYTNFYTSVQLNKELVEYIDEWFDDHEVE